MSIVPAPVNPGPWMLYRAFGVAGILLYIGISHRVGGRMADHERTSPWWPEVRSLTFEPYATLAEARKAEDQAIEAEHPVHNIARSAATH